MVIKPHPGWRVTAGGETYRLKLILKRAGMRWQSLGRVWYRDYPTFAEARVFKEYIKTLGLESFLIELPEGTPAPRLADAKTTWAFAGRPRWNKKPVTDPTPKEPLNPPPMSETDMQKLAYVPTTGWAKRRA